MKKQIIAFALSLVLALLCLPFAALAEGESEPAQNAYADTYGLDDFARYGTSEEYAIAVRKGEPELLGSINKTIQAMKADGTYDKLLAAFIPADGNIVLPAAIATSGSKTVKMGTTAAFPPFDYLESSDPVGFDITLSQMIARDYGAKLEVVNMEFDALIAALQSGAIDFIASGMTATDERRKNVDFSDTYFSTNQVIIVRK